MVIVDEIVSLDGYAARLDGSIDWFLDLREVVEDVSWPELISKVQAGLFGAETYEGFASYWPNRDPAYDVNRIEKHVVSSTLARAPWGSAQLQIHQDGAVKALEEVVASTSGDVIVWGSLTLSRELFENGLVGELWLRVVPVSLGEGLQSLPRRDIPFELLDCRHHESGLVRLRYRAGNR